MIRAKGSGTEKILKPNCKGLIDKLKESKQEKLGIEKQKQKRKPGGGMNE